MLSEMARLMFRRCRSSAQNMIHAQSMILKSIYVEYQMSALQNKHTQ